MSTNESVIVRGYQEGDKNFVFSTWIRGLYYGDSWFSIIPKNVFMTHYHVYLENRMAQPNTEVSVACLKEDHDVILGYAVHRIVDGVRVLDWVFVKSAWRNLGIAKLVTPKDFKVVTHLTKVGKALKPADCIFNPFQ